MAIKLSRGKALIRRDDGERRAIIPEIVSMGGFSGEYKVDYGREKTPAHLSKHVALGIIIVCFCVFMYLIPNLVAKMGLDYMVSIVSYTIGIAISGLVGIMAGIGVQGGDD